MVRSKPSSTGRRRPGRRSVTSRKRISGRGQAAGRRGRRRAAPRPRPSPASSRSDRRDRRGGAVEGPVEPAEGDHATCRRRPGRRRPPGRGRAGRRRRRRPAPRRRPRWPPTTRSRLQTTDRSRSRVASYCSSCSRAPAVDEAVDHPAGQAEQPQLLGRRRVDGQPVGVVGVALGRPHLVGVAVAPDRALAQQPVGGQPAPPSTSGAHQAKPNSTTAEARPATSSTRPPAMKSIEIDSGGPVMPRSKSRATVRSLGELRVLEVADARAARRRPR